LAFLGRPTDIGKTKLPLMKLSTARGGVSERNCSALALKRFRRGQDLVETGRGSPCRPSLQPRWAGSSLRYDKLQDIATKVNHPVFLRKFRFFET
jgi:hypothetical protein